MDGVTVIVCGATMMTVGVEPNPDGITAKKKRWSAGIGGNFMPEWLFTLGYITLASICVAFIIGFIITLIAVCIVVYKAWKEERKKRKE